MPASRTTFHSVIHALALLVPGLFLLSQLGLPLVEDGLFWWVPRALLLAQEGPRWVAAGELPDACMPSLALPPQWTGGLPDYGHPPLWFHYLALWIRLLGPHGWVVHAACLPVALGLGWACLGLTRRLGGPAAAPIAMVALACPPVLAQLLRPDTDLPLLAVSIAALLALGAGRLVSFALLAALATWLKEPAVLLAVPAATLALARRSPRHLAAASVAPLALLAWMAIHHHATGWALAGAEHLPAGPGAYLRDLGAVLALSLLATGRWLMLALAVAALLLRWRRAGPPRPEPPGTHVAADSLLACTSFLIAQLLVFAGLNFLGGRGLQDAYTHVRYLLPAITVAAIVLPVLTLRWSTAALPRLATHPRVTASLLALVLVGAGLPSARWLHPRGPEATLYGADQARAWQAAAEEIEEHRPALGTLWVESHLYTALTRPYAGLVQRPVPRLVPFGPATRPEDLQPGDVIVHSRYGEPLSRLGELRSSPIARYDHGSAWVKVDLVEPGRAAGDPSP